MIACAGTWYLDNAKGVSCLSYRDKLLGRNLARPTSFADKVRGVGKATRTEHVKVEEATTAVDKRKKATAAVDKACQTEPEVILLDGVRYVKYGDGEAGYSSS